MTFFGEVEPVRFEGPDSDNPLAYRVYDPDRTVLGKRMEDQMRVAVCYWHSFNWPGSDVFGQGTFDRPWLETAGDPMAAARDKMDAAFEFISKLGVPFFCFHDVDIAPTGETFAESARNLEEMVGYAEKKMAETGIRLLWGTANLFGHPRYAAGAATNPDPEVFAYAAAQVKHALEATHQLGGANYVLWGGREGTETDACRRPDDAVKRLREAVNYLCEYSIDRKYGFRFALESKPNEPRGDIYMASTGAYLGFIPTLDHPEMVGVNPEVAHEHMAGLNFVHAVAQAWEAGKLFHIDLNDQNPGRYDQDFRFGAANIRAAFFLVKFLEDVGYDNPRHFDAHANRTEDYDGVRDFARGCMRTYLILKEKAARWNADAEIQGLVREAASGEPLVSKYTA